MKSFALTLLSAAILMGCGASEEEEKTEPVATPNGVAMIQGAVNVKEGNDSESTLSLTIQLQRNAESDVTVKIKTQDVSAKAEKDYVAEDGNVLITKGSRSANHTVRIKSNSVHQADREFLFNIETVTGGNSVKGTVSSTKVTILDDDPEPVVSFKNEKTMVSEAAGTFTVPITLDRVSEKPTTIKLALAGLAIKDLDYRIDSMEYVVPPMTNGVDVNLSILVDQLIEGTEDIQLSLTSVANGKVGALNLSKVFISGDLKLPDTAYTKFYNNGDYKSSAPSSEHPYQDASYGLDLDQQYQDNGYAGLFMQKIDNNGNPMPADSSNHVCVTDNHTGLTFEVKQGIYERQGSTPEALATWGSQNWRSKANRYLWHDRDAKTNGGHAGGVNKKEFTDNIYVSDNCSLPDKDHPLYATAPDGCTSKQYLETFNKAAVCGFSDWRLPSMTELNTLVVYESEKSVLDGSYFTDENYPFIRGESEIRYLSSTPAVDNDASVWCLNANTKQTQLCNKQDYFYIRLVRGPKL